MGTKRKSAIIQPELAGVYMCEELLWIDKRKTTPHKISWPDRYKLLKKVIPYWLFKNMIFNVFKNQRARFLQYVPEQLNATYYLINEAGGMDKDGKDAVNDLTYLFLDVMAHARLRDPNYMARIHSGSPDEYVRGPWM